MIETPNGSGSATLPFWRRLQRFLGVASAMADLHRESYTLTSNIVVTMGKIASVG